MNRPLRLLGALFFLLWTLLGVPPQAMGGGQTLVLAGSGADLGTMRRLGEAFTAAHPGLLVEVLPSMGSGGGAAAVIAGVIDLALATRPLKASERRQGLRQVAYARTPLVFVTSSRHGAPGISREQMAGLFSGSYNHWPDGSEIRPILRPRQDSDTLLLRGFSAELSAALDLAYGRRGLAVAVTDQDAVHLIATVPGSVGTSTLALLLGEEVSLELLAIDGVAPSVATLADGSYALSKTLYFVLGPEPKPLALEFLAFVRSTAGASLLRRTGHLPLEAAAEGR